MLVSVSCTTYNHAAYIRQCLDGILMQQCSFPFEIVIHDDASTDGTRNILEEYQQRFPDRFFPMYQSQNQYALGKRGMMARYNFNRCRGKYIALCEGDDYWTDPYKLQKQIDFLEAHPEVNISMGKICYFFEKEQRFENKKEFIKIHPDAIFSLGDYLKQPFSQTSSFVLRKQNITIPSWYFETMTGDQSLVVIFAGPNGKIKVHDDYFSVYRVNKNSLMNRQLIQVLRNNNATFRHWDEYLGGQYHRLIQARIRENQLLCVVFSPAWVQKLYKHPFTEALLQGIYRIIHRLK
ncbi:MAG TPA: glycosyltransferase [Chitinophagaceae bacterium]|nr:glycosyltransferase [Chitinophagaceae bacterium]